MSTSSNTLLSVYCSGLDPLPAPEPLIMRASAEPPFTPPPSAVPSPSWVSTPQPPHPAARPAPPVRPAAQTTVRPPSRPRTPPRQPLDLTSLGPLDRRLAEVMMRPELTGAAVRRRLGTRTGEAVTGRADGRPA